MRRGSKPVEEEQIGAAGEVAGGGRHGFAVGVVSEAAAGTNLCEHEAKRLDPAVRQQGGLDHPLGQFQPRGHTTKIEARVAVG